MDQEQTIAASSREVLQSWDSKFPILVGRPSPLPGLALVNDPSKPDLLVSCKGWTWACHRHVLAKWCASFRGGFWEQESQRIDLEHDEPRVVEALLLYIHSLSSNAFRDWDPLFSDVEPHLDIFVIADKYDLQPLRKYMNDNLVLFYETDKTPPLDPKGWSAKNQTGFGKVLTKLYRLDTDTTDIRKAIINFMIRAGQKVMRWEAVRKAVEDDAQLSSDLIMAFFATKRSDDSRVKNLEDEIRDLDEQVAKLQEVNEDLKGENEYLSDLLDARKHEIATRDDFNDSPSPRWSETMYCRSPQPPSPSPPPRSSPSPPSPPVSSPLPSSPFPSSMTTSSAPSSPPISSPPATTT